MTGLAQPHLEVPVVKSSTGVIVLPPDMTREWMEYTDCVRCDKCVEHCPMMLYPNQISIYAEAGLHEKAEEWDLMDCIECGICSYVCPAARPVVHWVQRAKPEIQKLQRSRK